MSGMTRCCVVISKMEITTFSSRLCRNASRLAAPDSGCCRAFLCVPARRHRGRSFVLSGMTRCCVVISKMEITTFSSRLCRNASRLAAPDSGCCRAFLCVPARRHRGRSFVLSGMTRCCVVVSKMEITTFTSRLCRNASRLAAPDSGCCRAFLCVASMASQRRPFVLSGMITCCVVISQMEITTFSSRLCRDAPCLDAPCLDAPGLGALWSGCTRAFRHWPFCVSPVRSFFPAE